MANPSGLKFVVCTDGDIPTPPSGKVHLYVTAAGPRYKDSTGTASGFSGTVTSFNGRTGAVTPAQADYDSFFLTQAEGTALYQAIDAELTAIAGLTSAADQLPYFTGSGTAALTTLTTAGRALIDDADAAAQRTTLGLGKLAVANCTTGSYANLGIIDSVTSSILTLTLKQADGTTDPSASAPVYVNMRHPTATVGGSNIRSVTSAITLALQAAATLGFSGSNLTCYLWVYLIDTDGAGTMALGCSQVRLDDTELTSAVQASGTATMTIATPCVVTETGHNRSNNDQVMFSTTGALPTGVTAGTTYWISNVTTDTYRLNTSPGGTNTGGAAVNSSGSQSGTHTVKTMFAAGKVIATSINTTARPIKLISRHRFNLNSSGTWIASTSIALADVVPTLETVAWSFSTNNATAHGNGTHTVINWVTNDYRTHFMDSGTNSWFQAPVSGYYSISIQLANALASWVADSYFAAGIYVNAATGGTQTWTLGEWVSQDAPATSTYSNLAATRVIKLTAGDYVNIAYINGAGVSLSLDAQAIDCWLNITRVG